MFAVTSPHFSTARVKSILPAEADAGPADDAPALRILLVEDDETTRAGLKMYLETLGHIVAAAGGMTEALAQWRKANYELLISDIGLPDGDGWLLLQMARSVRPLYSIALSGNASNAHRAKSERCGFHHHLTKPIKPEDLKKLLETAYRVIRGGKRAGQRSEDKGAA